MGINGVVEAEKGREKERVEKQRLAMTTWREGEGEESPRGAREKLRVREVRVRGSKRVRGAKQSFLY